MNKIIAVQDSISLNNVLLSLLSLWSYFKLIEKYSHVGVIFENFNNMYYKNVVLWPIRKWMITWF